MKNITVAFIKSIDDNNFNLRSGTSVIDG